MKCIPKTKRAVSASVISSILLVSACGEGLRSLASSNNPEGGESAVADALDTASSTESISAPIPAGIPLSPCFVYSCYARSSFDETTPHQVGRIEQGRLKTDGTDGYLLFGPYAMVDPGQYSLVLNGIIEASNNATVDVVSAGGEAIHAAFPLTQSAGLIVDETVTIPAQVQDLQIRVFVTKDTVGQLTGVSFKPLNE